MSKVIWWIVLAMFLLASPALLESTSNYEPAKPERIVQQNVPQEDPGITCEQLKDLVRALDPDAEPGTCVEHHDTPIEEKQHNAHV
jgi:hypothetical protein